MSAIENRIADLLEIWAARRQLDPAVVERGLSLHAGWLADLRAGREPVRLAELDHWLTVLEVPAAVFLAALAGVESVESLLPEAADTAAPGLSRRELEALLVRVQERLAELAGMARARVELEEPELALVDELP